MTRGFILQPTYRIESGRPVVTIFGKLESGESFLIRDDRQVPRFYVLESDSQDARKLGGEVGPDERTSLRGEPLARVEIQKPQDAPPAARPDGRRRDRDVRGRRPFRVPLPDRSRDPGNGGDPRRLAGRRRYRPRVSQPGHRSRRLEPRALGPSRSTSRQTPPHAISSRSHSPGAAPRRCCCSRPTAGRVPPRPCAARARRSCCARSSVGCVSWIRT